MDEDAELERRYHGEPVGSLQGEPKGLRTGRTVGAAASETRLGEKDKKPGVAGLEGVRSV